MKNIFSLLFIVIWFQVLAQESASEFDTDFNVAKLALTSNSSPVLETTLLELDVTYDLALVKNDYQAASMALRQMGLAYYNSGYFNISKDYVLKAKIIAEKYGIKEQNLRCAALLSKINLKLGDNRASNQMEDEYFLILSTIKQESLEASSQSQSAINPVLETTEVESKEDTAGFPMRVIFMALGLVGLLVLLNYFPTRVLEPQSLNEEIQVEKSTKLMDIDINMESLNLIDLTDDAFFENIPPEPVVAEKVEKIEKVKIVPQVQNQPKEEELVLKEETVIAQEKEIEEVSIPVEEKGVEEVIEPVPVQKPEPVVASLKDEALENRVVEKEKEEFVAETKSYHPKKVQPLTQESILAARGNSFYEKAETEKLPLWVSGIEHHFKNVNAINGIRFDFNYTGDFSQISTEVHTTFTKFLRALTDELAESNNVNSVSAILVNSSIGLVIQLVARPIHPHEPVLPLKSQNFYSDIISKSNVCDVMFKESENGVLKTVLKHVETKRELV